MKNSFFLVGKVVDHSHVMITCMNKIKIKKHLQNRNQKGTIPNKRRIVYNCGPKKLTNSNSENEYL